jgi:hypothetical protein
MNHAFTEMVARRGYLVLAHEFPLPIGTVFDRVRNGPLPQPFVITMRTDYRDWLQQEKVAVELGGERRPSPPDDFYYRAVTD